LIIIHISYSLFLFFVVSRGEFVEGTKNRVVTITGTPTAAQTAHIFITQRLRVREFFVSFDLFFLVYVCFLLWCPSCFYRLLLILHLLENFPNKLPFFLPVFHNYCFSYHSLPLLITSTLYSIILYSIILRRILCLPVCCLPTDQFNSLHLFCFVLPPLLLPTYHNIFSHTRTHTYIRNTPAYYYFGSVPSSRFAYYTHILHPLLLSSLFFIRCLLLFFCFCFCFCFLSLLL
jgi:hypothetical protein